MNPILILHKKSFEANIQEITSENDTKKPKRPSNAEKVIISLFVL